MAPELEELNKPQWNKSHSIPPSPALRRDRERERERVKEKLEYGYFAENMPDKLPFLDKLIAVMLELRREDAPFKALADRATAELYKSPEIEVMYRKWLEAPTPPKGINYRVPMSPELRNAFAHPSSSFDPDVYGMGK